MIHALLFLLSSALAAVALPAMSNSHELVRRGTVDGLAQKIFIVIFCTLIGGALIYVAVGFIRSGAEDRKKRKVKEAAAKAQAAEAQMHTSIAPQ
ncbi:hypothetical protein BCR33DRAFT_716772 [Rhizoclosmatium globosum]|uniref:CcmD family protein n=1 Tax=Rhizoclosmatium globosum TaxID=329046 RepID=A0A1Y2CCR5_9FUNG|nr:hypothetical protein HDU79_010952 [Rhizoclosmatium sp. JEL0117]ORY44823.1 hypothetical protein BCR33DRAFT_716772 [Rhizoclosmatium globosum]|eukprot:ORY44823.1 hypothetical protein BCR33DRAFT_716772 [Rhizoclosmatium globosum]